MKCKNCENELNNEDGFCSKCGARIIEERISYGFIIKEIFDKVLSIDNKLLKTFWHLFTKPQQVIENYIDGVRKRYFNPFSYLLISLTLAGASTLILRKATLEAILSNQPEAATNASLEFTTKMMNFVFDYQSIFTILLIPVYALISWIVFLNRKKFNFFRAQYYLLVYNCSSIYC